MKATELANLALQDEQRRNNIMFLAEAIGVRNAGIRERKREVADCENKIKVLNVHIKDLDNDALELTKEVEQIWSSLDPDASREVRELLEKLGLLVP